jgi:hypothetical protein
MGLNEFYSAIRGQILSKNSLLDVTKAYSCMCKKKSSEVLGGAREIT